MAKKMCIWAGLLLAAAWIAGCYQHPSPSGDAQTAPQGLREGDKYLLSAEPADAQGVIRAREQAKDGDPIVVAGRVGGSKEPCVKGRAAFTIVDPSYQSCDERGETCETPWDYCHATKDEMTRATAMVKVVDAGGKTLAYDAQDLLGIQPLQTVVVRGKAKRDDNGNLTVLAEGIYIRPRPK
jgi:hypothetical protein